MRIALVTDTYLPEVNGVTTVLSTMRRGLLDRGHAVQVVAPAYAIGTDDEDRVLRRPAVACPGYSAVHLSWPWDPAVSQALVRFEPDIIHSVTEGPLGLQGRRFARRHSIPLATSFHTNFPQYMRRYLGEWAVGVTRRYLGWFHSRAVVTQTPSHVVQRELAALGVPHAVVWGRGVDTGHFRPERRNESRRAERGAAGKALVLHVGRLAVEKDVDTLIAAFRLAHQALGDRARFCVAGDGPAAQDVRASLPFALHLGFLGRGDLADLFADADLFVFPSRTETCGLVALEGMASGLPVIAAAEGGVVENLVPDVTGILNPPGDAPAFARAIRDLVTDPVRLRAMAAGARAFAVGRDWNIEIDLLIPMYEAILRAPDGATGAADAHRIVTAASAGRDAALGTSM